MTKAELRRQFLSRRRALTSDDVAHRSESIAHHVFQLTPLIRQLSTPDAGVIHIFLPIIHQNEVNTWPIIQRFWQDYPAVRLATSITDTASNQLSHYLLTPETKLVENRWGIPEPQPDERFRIDSSQISTVLVPLLVFDRHGDRVGYGKGYYDRFLAECRPDCLNIGLSLFDPVDKIDDVEPTDVLLTCCVSPDKSWLFDDRL
jgi:5-formyltetrahydrofolate cyclo-ligase